MPRAYGGTVADVLVDSNGRPVANAALHVFDAAVGGTDVTAQMTDPDGTAFVGALGSSAGLIRAFRDPQDRDLWANAVDSAGNEVDRPRVLLIPSDLRSRQATIETSGGGGGVAGVASFQGRTGAVTLTKADVTGTGLAAADVGAETPSGAQAKADAATAAANSHSDTALSAHENDTTAAHAASAVSLDPTGLGHVSGTDVQAAVSQLDAAITSGTAGVSSFNTRTGAVSLTKADVTGTGLAAADVGADPAGSAAAITTSSIGAQPADTDLTAIAALDSATAGAIASDGAGWVKKTYAQLKTALGLTKADVGLGSVDNTADSAKPVSTAQQTALDAKVGTAQLGVANGVATLGADGILTAAQRPAGSATSGPPTVTTIAASGASQALAFSDTAETMVFDVTLDQDCEFTLAGGTAGKRSLIELRLHPNGHKAIWPAGVAWPSQVIPPTSAVAGALDTFVFATIDAAATVDGQQVGQNSQPPGVPDAPTGLTATAGNAQVALSWIAPNPHGSAITDYVIQTSTDSGTTWSTFSDGVSATTSATVSPLTNGTPVLLRVAAVNAVGQGAWATSGSVTPTGGGTTVVSATFTGADNSSSLGNADTGQAFTIHGGTWGTASNKARVTAAANLTMCAAVVDTGAVDRTVQADITFDTINYAAGLTVREQDANNNLFALCTYSGTSYSTTNISIFKTVGGTQTTLASTAAGTSPALGSSHTMAVVTNGADIDVLIDGVSVLTYTLISAEQATFLATDTHAGLKEWVGSLSSSGDRGPSGGTTFDNLLVTT